MLGKWSIAIHGGAGNISKDVTEEFKKKYLNGLQQAISAGIKVLESGGSAANAVCAAVASMEDNPLFNAGKGAVYNSAGKHELDASFMDGKTLSAGSFGGINGVKNPIYLAKHIAFNSKHICFTNDEALKIAQDNNFELVDEDYYCTENRYQAYLKCKEKNEMLLDHSFKEQYLDNQPKGTVGAVACDCNGNLAAATSTGGMTLKTIGRIGDTGIIGAGTYANNDTCAVSCTGIGEKFIINQTAHSIHLLMQQMGLSLSQACDKMINEIMDKDDGGLIAVDNKGNICLPFNSTGMYKAEASSDSSIKASIW